MNEGPRNLIVGLTAIAGLVILGYLIMIFGGAPKWFTPSYPLAIYFDDASGIASGTRVRLNGIDIGYVESVELQEPSYKGVKVACLINEKQLIPATVKPVATAGLLGGAALLNLRTRPPLEGIDEQYLPRDGSAQLTGSAADLASEITGVATRLEANLSDQLVKFGRMADEFTAVGVEVRSLLNEQDVTGVESGREGGNLRTLIAHADQRIMEMRTTLENFNSLLSEDMRDEVKGVIGDVRGLTKDAREKLDTLADKLIAVSDDLGQTLQVTNALLSDAREGKGTIGRLMQDPQLHNALTNAANRLTDTLNEAKLLIQKWKAEGLPVNAF